MKPPADEPATTASRSPSVPHESAELPGGEDPSGSWQGSAESVAARRRTIYSWLIFVVLVVGAVIAFVVTRENRRSTLAVAIRSDYGAESEVGSASREYSSATPASHTTDERIELLRLLEAARDRERETSNAEVLADQAVETLDNLLLPGVVIVVILFILLVVGSFLYRAEARRNYETQELLKRVEERARQKGLEAAGPGGDSLALRALWAENRSRIEGYHKLVTSYAASTRRLTSTTLAIAFGFLLLTSVVALLARSSSAAIATSVVAASGAALGGFVANAVLKNAEASAREVQAFFAHPLHLERQLTAERLLETMKEPLLSQARLALIASNGHTQKAADSDQNHPATPRTDPSVT